MQTLLLNDKVKVGFTENHYNGSWISFYDLTDQYNDTQGFTRNVRGIKKAVKFITEIANDERLKDDLTFHDINKVLENFKLKPHTYCGMD